MKLLPILEYGKFCETKGGRFRVSQLCLGGLAWFCRGFTSSQSSSLISLIVWKDITPEGM